MNFDDQILQWLGTHPDIAYSAQQIGSGMDKEWSLTDPNWAVPSLELLVIQGRVHFGHGKFCFRSRFDMPLVGVA